MPPSASGAWAVTCTGPAEPGNVSVTEATPDPFVTAITEVPLVVPFDSDPAVVVNRMLAPAAAPPDCPGASVTVSGWASADPALPDCPLPVWVSVAGGLPTTIQPPSVCVAVPSLPVTVKWQNPGDVVPIFTAIDPGSVGVTVEVPIASRPPHFAVPSNASKTADDKVTFVVPLVIFGCSVTVPPVGTMIVSGFRSQSDAGAVARLPLITSSVALYGAKLCDADHACEADAVIVVEALDASV